MNKELFLKLLSKPKLTDLPKDFDVNIESEFLAELFSDATVLKDYEFCEFIAAGGSGMIFRVRTNSDPMIDKALKLIRKKVSEFPFADEEIEAMQELTHKNIIYTYGFIKNSKDEIIGTCNSYINNPQGFDKYIEQVLNSDSLDNASQERLSNACKTIISWIEELSNALNYMHSKGYYHLDIKPANILIKKDEYNNSFTPILTDFGSCIKKNSKFPIRVHFTWTYAHPDLADIENNPGSIEGGGVRASSKISDDSKLESYDLHAFGKTIQQVLAIVESHFGEAANTNYLFKYMHIISALLLNGKNRTDGTKISETVLRKNGIRFVTDFPMGLSEDFFIKHKISSSFELTDIIRRYRQDYSIVELAEEFSSRTANVINNVIGDPIPFTNRVANVFNHPTIKRLYHVLQLGAMNEIYPGASHNRWSHTLGVYGLLLKYLCSLLCDPDNPTFKIIVKKTDIDHAILAVILHDAGQTTYGHDLEYANNVLFEHTNFFLLLLDEKSILTKNSLTDVFRDDWKNIDLKRLEQILRGKEFIVPIDNIISDIISSAIDADKIDYILRDSYYCGVPYGNSIDVNRFINSLTIKEKNKTFRLAYYSKGRAAVAAVLLARYQLYSSIYWHHTYRCLHAMVSYAIKLAFPTNIIQISSTKKLSSAEIRQLFFYRVICKQSWEKSWKKVHINLSQIPSKYNDCFFEDDFGLDFIWKFTDEYGRKLLTEFASRDIYKRLFSRSLKGIDISELQKKCSNIFSVSLKVQKVLFDEITSMRLRCERPETASEKQAIKEIDELGKKIAKQIFILVDFPVKITIPNATWPAEVSDFTRKFQNYLSDDFCSVIDASNNMLIETACIRVYCNKTLFGIITRYLKPDLIEKSINRAIDYNGNHCFCR